MPLDVYSGTMRRAAELAGGEQKLADALGAKRTDVRAWINGDRIPSLAVFFAAAELIRTLNERSGGQPRGGDEET